MKHRTNSGRYARLLVYGAVSILVVCGKPAAGGEGSSASRQGAAAPKTGINLHDRQPATITQGPTIAAARTTTAVTLDTSWLRNIESRTLPPPLVHGPNHHAKLPDYYWAENRQLRQRLEQAKNAFHRTPTPAFRGLTLVAGAAGVGKTFIKGEVFNKDCPPSATCKFDVPDLYEQWVREGIAANKPDLASDDLVISYRKSVTDKSRPRLREYLEAQHAGFYVIDSLDEVHPDDYAWVLHQVEDFVVRRKQQFVHVAVFGRGFAFRDFWHQRTAGRDQADVELYLLNPPTFRTTGDLLVSSWNYHSWKYDLAWAPDGREADKMTFDAYRQWVASGFSRNDRFQSITFETNDDMRTDVQDALVHGATKSRVVGGALYNLAGNSFIREILRRETLAQRPFDECRIARAYLDAWLARETKVHDRPSREKPEYLDLYLSLLEQVAVTHLTSQCIDEKGFFPIGQGDTVTVRHNHRPYAFPVRQILERSGLVATDPRTPGVAKYRFEPVWIHRLLVEMYDERAGAKQQLTLGSGAN
jgi:hypothetical protein